MKNKVLNLFLALIIGAFSIGCSSVPKEEKTREEKLVEWSNDVRDAVTITAALVIKKHPDSKAKFVKAADSLEEMAKTDDIDLNLVFNIFKNLELENVDPEDADVYVAIAKIVLRRAEAFANANLDINNPDEVKMFAGAIEDGIREVTGAD